MVKIGRENKSQHFFPPSRCWGGSLFCPFFFGWFFFLGSFFWGGGVCRGGVFLLVGGFCFFFGGVREVFLSEP